MDVQKIAFVLAVVLLVEVRIYSGSCPPMYSCSTEGEIRLEGGPSEREGRVEVCLNGCWSGVCRHASWGTVHEIVLCRQLGYLEYNFPIRLNIAGRMTNTVVYNVHCLAFEEKLIHCSHQVGFRMSCEIAGARCMEGVPPRDLNVHSKADNYLTLTWDPPNSTLASNKSLTLSGYTARCSAATLQSQHTVEVTATKTTRNITITGLRLRESDYECCVTANYGNYHPRVCINANHTDITDNTTTQTHTELDVSTGAAGRVDSCTTSSSTGIPASEHSTITNTSTLHSVGGGLLGTAVVVMLLVLVLGTATVVYHTKSRANSKRMHEGNPGTSMNNLVEALQSPRLHQDRHTSTCIQEDSDLLSQNQQHSYEEVDLQEIKGSRGLEHSSNNGYTEVLATGLEFEGGTTVCPVSIQAYEVPSRLGAGKSAQPVNTTGASCTPSSSLNPVSDTSWYEFTQVIDQQGATSSSKMLMRDHGRYEFAEAGALAGNDSISDPHEAISNPGEETVEAKMLMRERYEFAEAGALAGNDSISDPHEAVKYFCEDGDDCDSVHEQPESKDHAPKEYMNIQTVQKEVRFDSTYSHTGLPGAVAGSENHSYSHINLMGRDEKHMYVGSSRREHSTKDHSYSHVSILSNKCPSPGYSPLEMGKFEIPSCGNPLRGGEAGLMKTPENSDALHLGKKATTGYSHLEVNSNETPSEATPQLVVSNDSTCAKGYSKLEVTTGNEEAAETRKQSINTAPVTGYSHLNVDEMEDIKAGGESKERVAGKGYSHLDITQGNLYS